MKKLLYLSAALLMLIAPLTALAATDISGNWTTALKAPDGSAGFQLTFTFKQDGEKLTGSVQGAQGDPIAISNGKVDADKISFTVSYNGATITHQGTIGKSADGASDEIKLTSKSDSGDFPGAEMTLKRAK